MCNIAGYSGSRQAAPILLEMLRKQEPYDGDMSTGVATIHEGKLYYKKIIGNVDAFLEAFDLNDLPGTIGIAHTRPGGAADSSGVPLHPSLDPLKTMALVTNGTTPKTKYSYRGDKAADLLEEKGYPFIHRDKNPKGESPKVSSNGDYISPVEMRVFLIDLYTKEGKSIEEAMAMACADLYSDNVTVMVNENYPDTIFALRTTRPLQVVQENGEVYMATTRFGFPEELKNEPWMLPLFHVCKITKDGIIIAPEKMDMEPVAEMSPYTYKEAYARFEALLKSEKAPLFFDHLEYAADDMRDIWEGDHTCVQNARLVYDMLWQFDREGRLKKEMRVQELSMGPRHRWYFSLEK